MPAYAEQADHTSPTFGTIASVVVVTCHARPRFCISASTSLILESAVSYDARAIHDAGPGISNSHGAFYTFAPALVYFISLALWHLGHTLLFFR